MPAPVGKQASRSSTLTRSPWTTNDCAAAMSSDACFALAKEASEASRRVHSSLVQLGRLGAATADASFHAQGGARRWRAAGPRESGQEERGYRGAHGGASPAQSISASQVDPLDADAGLESHDGRKRPPPIGVADTSRSGSALRCCSSATTRSRAPAWCTRASWCCGAADPDATTQSARSARERDQHVSGRWCPVADGEPVLDARRE
jgi:hypothetical protein